MTAPTHSSASVRVIAYKEGDGPWLAQCLEYDIAAQGDTPDEAYERVLIELELDRQESIRVHGAPFAGIERAPHHFFDLWERRVKTLGSHKQIDHTDVEMALAA